MCAPQGRAAFRAIQEEKMNGLSHPRRPFQIFLLAGWFIASAVAARGQDVRSAASSGTAPADSPATPEDVRALSGLIRDLQEQVQMLNMQLGDLRKEQELASAQARVLRHELDAIKGQPAQGGTGPLNPYGPPPANRPGGQSASTQTSEPVQQQTPESRIATLEEQMDVTEGKVNDQYQTKVESGSKYRLRLSGIVLLNLVENHGTVDNLDFPSFAESRQSEEPHASPSAFGASLRQSQIKLQAFGPDVAGAHTSADINFDFAGGYAAAPNGNTMGLVRLRTGTLRFDWGNTSIVGGQDRLFFAPLAPTSLATIAIPALSYAGNLWAWTPQVRIEHRIILSDSSSLSVQGGILDNTSGDLPNDPISRYPTWGEQSGQPAYAARVAWTHAMSGQNLTVGLGGYYGRQDWGFSRSVDGWAGTVDLAVPLGKRWEFTGEFYRGRAVAGLGGGIGQSVYPNGPFFAQTTVFRGLDSVGGWAQMKFKVRSNLEINTAFGLDNPFDGELRKAYSTFYAGQALSRNIVPLANFIYQIRSDILFSVEYRYLDTSILDTGSNRASHVNVSLGYIF
jgi:hypothetical protein